MTLAERTQALALRWASIANHANARAAAAQRRVAELEREIAHAEFTTAVAAQQLYEAHLGNEVLDDLDVANDLAKLCERLRAQLPKDYRQVIR